MIVKDSGRLRMMEKLCKDKGINTVVLVLDNGEDAFFSSETADFTAIEVLLFEMACTKDSCQLGTLYVNTAIRPLDVIDLERLKVSRIFRVITNEKSGDGLLESAKELEMLVESEKDAQ